MLYLYDIKTFNGQYDINDLNTFFHVHTCTLLLFVCSVGYCFCKFMAIKAGKPLTRVLCKGNPKGQ